MHIYRLFIAVIILELGRGDAQTLNCGQSGISTFGQPFELYCTLTGQATAYYSVILKKETANFMQIPTFETNVNATFYDDTVKSRVSASVSVTPGISRTVTVRFSSLECIDNGVYNWTISILTTETVLIAMQQTVTLKVIPEFGSDDGNNITYSPSTNLVEGDVVTFTCQGDVGNTPVGNLLWYYYLNGNSTETDVSSKSTAVPAQDSTVAGRTCSKTRVSTLNLTLTKAMHWFVVRCTVNQHQPFNATGQGYKMTQQINVQYKPAITSLNSVPAFSQYTEGDALLTLTCTADSNPPPSYYWIYESKISNRSQIGTGPKQELRNLTLNHTGVYTCVAYNLIKGINKTVNASVQITVVETTTTALVTTSERSISTSQLYKPNIISLTRDPNDDVYVEGLEILTLTCVADGNPPPLYTWVFQSGYDNQEQVGHGNQLILRRLTTQHTGIYTCLLYNTLNGNNQSAHSSTIVYVELMTVASKSPEMMSKTKGIDASVVGTTFGVTVAVMAIISGIVFVVLGRRYRCVKRQGRDNHRDVGGSSRSLECAEYQTTPYYSIPAMYETLERTSRMDEPYSQLDPAKRSSVKNV